jgi:hypothetical protein
MYFESQISGAGRVSRSSVPGAILSGSRDLLDSLRLFFDISMIWNVTNGAKNLIGNKYSKVILHLWLK